MLIQLVCLLSYFISRDVIPGELFTHKQIKLPCEWMTNQKDNSPENIREPKRANNKQNWAGPIKCVIIWKLKNAWGLGRITVKAPAKRSQHVNVTLTMFSAPTEQCCNILRWHIAIVWPGLKLCLYKLLYSPKDLKLENCWLINLVATFWKSFDLKWF